MGVVKRPDEIRDTYFSLWTLTEKGVSDAAALQATIRTASAMIRDAKGTCSLYVTVGSPYDLIGVAKGEKLEDEKITAIQQAIKAFGTLRTDFIKAREFSLDEYASYLADVTRLRALRP
jgi:uncharacterized protein with GYD domain